MNLAEVFPFVDENGVHMIEQLLASNPCCSVEGFGASPTLASSLQRYLRGWHGPDYDGE